MIYLDNAATTKPYIKVIKTIENVLNGYWENPSANYSEAKYVNKLIEDSKKVIAHFIGSDKDEIYFTSCGSESNCWAIKGFVDYWISKGREPVVITTVIEHKSIIECVDHLPCDFRYIGVDSTGCIDICHLENILKSYNKTDKKILVSIQFANNEIGTIQNIKMIADTVHYYGGVFHTDAVQAFGAIDINVNNFGIDMMSVSGHKIHATKGIGFLYIRNGISILPLIYGSQNNGMRGGTYSTAYICGFATAVGIAEEMNNDFHTLYDTLHYDKFATSIGCRETDRDKEINPSDVYKKREFLLNFMHLNNMDFKINGNLLQRLPNNLSIILPEGVSAEAIIHSLDSDNICISAGSACNSQSIEVSYVLKAIGLSDSEAMRTIRITVGELTKEEEIKEFVYKLQKAIKVIKLMEENDNE